MLYMSQDQLLLELYADESADLRGKLHADVKAFQEVE